MIKIDEQGLKLCKIQGEIFSASIIKANCSSPIFLRRFMNSSVARRMDMKSFLYESSHADNIFEEIQREYGESNYGKEKYSVEELYWMGYIYRYCCYTKEKSSKQLYKIIKPDQLRKLYFPYHSLDPADVIDRISEANDLEENLTKKGVEILRRIQNSKK